MQRLLAALSIVVAFVAGRSLAPVAPAAKPIVTIAREVIAAPCAPMGAEVTRAAVEVARDAGPEDEDDPAAIEIAETTAMHALETDVTRLAALEAGLGVNGALFGRVRDAHTNEVLVGVTVVVSARGLSQVALTDETGYFQLAGLAPDRYQVTLYFGEATLELPELSITRQKSTPLYTSFDTNARPVYSPPIMDDEYVTSIPVGRTFEAVLGAEE